MALLFVSFYFEVFAHSHGEGHVHSHEHGDGHLELSTVLSITGAALMITAHVINLKLCRCLKDKDASPEDVESVVTS